MAVDIGGLVSIIVFYLIILLVGLWGARKTGFKTKNLKMEDILLANRSINFFVGFFTLTATWIGGGLINGTAEIVAHAGLVWCQSPLGYAISDVFSGIFFVKKMRSSCFTTMLDPFYWKFGKIMNCLLYFPAFIGDVCWAAAILEALGATLKVILDINLEFAVVISTAIALVYTLLGGLYSVAYTDIIQLILIFIGMWLCVPFILTDDATEPITTNSSEVWLGTLEVPQIAIYIDIWLLFILGGLPWQVLWQRNLSAKTVRIGQIVNILAGLASLFMSVPSVLIGAAAASTNWTMTDYGKPSITEDDAPLTMPLALKHLCPKVVGIIGLGAISAAVMSSADSAILSASTMFCRNVFGVIYASITKNRPSKAMLIWVMRAAQLVTAAVACLMAIEVSSIYSLLLISTDLVYVLLFPQLLCVMYMKKANSYGSFMSFFSGLILRMLSGEEGLDFPTVIEYPWYNDGSGHLFPFRTFCMLVSLFSLIIVSLVTDFLFRNEIIPLRYDFYSSFQHLSKECVQNGKQTADASSSSKRSVYYNGVGTTTVNENNLVTRF